MQQETISSNKKGSQANNCVSAYIYVYVRACARARPPEAAALMLCGAAKKTCEGGCPRAAIINERAAASGRTVTSEPKNAEGSCRLRGRT